METTLHPCPDCINNVRKFSELVLKETVNSYGGRNGRGGLQVRCVVAVVMLCRWWERPFDAEGYGLWKVEGVDKSEPCETWIFFEATTTTTTNIHFISNTHTTYYRNTNTFGKSSSHVWYYNIDCRLERYNHGAKQDEHTSEWRKWPCQRR
jgi:hypothetical protein